MASKKNRRSILIASCVMAALIVGGSTFAWFTSKDEVVNKISATSNYNVVAVEDFTPPNNWTPGQTVDKDVRVTNTGNVDAFVRASISGDLVLTRMTNSAAASEDTLKKAIELSTAAVNPNNPDTSAESKDQVRAKQAGSRLVYSADTNYGAPKTYDEALLEGSGVTLTKDDNNTFVTVDEGNAADFKPTTTGYYIFARSTTEDQGTAGFVSKIVYDGYYFVKGENAADKYYDIEVTADASNPYKITAKLRQKETVLIDDSELKYTVSTDKKTLTAKYNGGTTDTATDDIVIDIALDNVNEWTAADGGKTYYYNKILKAGQTTNDFVTSVTLNNKVKKDAFLAMDYNLKVTVDSVQVTDDDAKTTAAEAEWDKTPTVNGENVNWTPVAPTPEP